MAKHQSLFFLCIVFLMFGIRLDAQVVTFNNCADCNQDSTLKLYTDSIKIIDHQIALYPDSSWLYSKRGSYHFSIHDFPNTKLDLQKALAIDSNNLYAYLGLGYINNIELNYSSAIPYFTKYLNLNPDDFSICYTIGEILMLANQTEAAIPFLIKSLKDSTIQFEKNEDLAWCYSYISDYGNAKKHYQIALEKVEEYIREDTLNAQNYFWRAYINTQLNNYRNVLEDYDKSILLDSTCVRTYFFRGMARKSLNKPKESCADLYTSLLLGYSQDAYDLLCESCKALCLQYTKAHPHRKDEPASGYWVH